MKRALLTGMYSVVALVWSCSSPVLVDEGGTASETVIGRVITPAGAPVQGAEVKLVRSDYNPRAEQCASCVKSALCDSAGKYTFSSVDTGSYNVTAHDPSAGTRALVTHTVTGVDSAQLSDAVLRKPASLRIQLPDTADTVAYCYVAGTMAHSQTVIRVNDIAYIRIDSLPPARGYTIKLVGTGGEEDTAARIEKAEATSGEVNTYVAPGGTAGQSKVLTLNTTASGADVAGTVTAFPVLVRLDTLTFDFAGASASGSDIQFVSATGKVLPHEIEQWDSAAGQAVIWVRLDTIAGNGYTSLIMRWGRQGAETLNAGAWVFDTADGFDGVWHLDEERAGKSGDSIYRDATPNGFYGIDNISATGREGVIGYGHTFSETDSDWVDLGRNRAFLRAASGATLEAWVWRSGQGGFGYLLNHSVGAPTPADSSRALLFLNSYSMAAIGGRSIDTGSVESISSGDTLPPVSWHHMTGVIDYANDSTKIYVDGTLAASLHTPFPTAATPATLSQYSAMGASDMGTEGYFDGALDEVRTHHVARNAAWIRLSYENQKPGQTLVEFPLSGRTVPAESLRKRSPSSLQITKDTTGTFRYPVRYHQR